MNGGLSASALLTEFYLVLGLECGIDSYIAESRRHDDEEDADEYVVYFFHYEGIFDGGAGGAGAGGAGMVRLVLINGIKSDAVAPLITSSQRALCVLYHCV